MRVYDGHNFVQNQKELLRMHYIKELNCPQNGGSDLCSNSVLSFFILQRLGIKNELFKKNLKGKVLLKTGNF